MATKTEVSIETLPKLVEKVHDFVLAKSESGWMRDTIGSYGSVKTFFKVEKIDPDLKAEFFQRYDAAIAGKGKNGPHDGTPYLKALIELNEDLNPVERDYADIQVGAMDEGAMDRDSLMFQRTDAFPTHMVGWLLAGKQGPAQYVESWMELEKILCGWVGQEAATAKAMARAMQEVDQVADGDISRWELTGKETEQAGWRVIKMGNTKEPMRYLFEAMREIKKQDGSSTADILEDPVACSGHGAKGEGQESEDEFQR